MPRRGVRSQAHTPRPAESQDKRLDKWNKFRLEYDSLKAERAKLREEVTSLDDRAASGDILKKQHDKEYRLKLAKAGELSRRIAKLVGEMARLGKIPDDHQV